MHNAKLSTVFFREKYCVMERRFLTNAVDFLQNYIHKGHLDPKSVKTEYFTPCFYSQQGSIRP